MKIYIASSWKNQHSVEMLTDKLRGLGYEVLSFVENNRGENSNSALREKLGIESTVSFDEWCCSPDGIRSFHYDTEGATTADLVIYIGPSGTDAWAEVGAAWASGRSVLGLWAKGEPSGLMRLMVDWKLTYRELIDAVREFETGTENVMVSPEQALTTTPDA